MRVTKAVIPAAGLGTRLLPLSKAVPKELLPVGRKPCIQWVVEELYDAGIREILFIVSEQKGQILQHFTDNDDLRRKIAGKADPVLAGALDYLDCGITFHSVLQRPLLGLGHAVACAQEFTAGEPFVVALGDAVIRTLKGVSVTRRLVDSLEVDDAFGVAVRTVEGEDVSKYGIVVAERDIAKTNLSDRGCIVSESSCTGVAQGGARERRTTECDRKGSLMIRSLIEKPSPRDTDSRLAISGRYVFQDVIYEALGSVSRGKDGEFQLTDAMNLLVQQGHRAKAVRLSEYEYRYDVGNQRDYLKAVIDYGLTDGPYAGEMRRHTEEVLAGFLKA